MQITILEKNKQAGGRLATREAGAVSCHEHNVCNEHNRCKHTQRIFAPEVFLKKDIRRRQLEKFFEKTRFF
jgi:hypothetical protein